MIKSISSINPKISIVIPLFNKKHSIVSTIESVMNQSFTNFELIIVDDGSDDSSVSLVKNIYDKRIRLFCRINQGVSNARNFGISNSTGEYVFLLDADDIIKLNCLEELNRLTLEYPDALVYTANFIAKAPSGEEQIVCKRKERGYITNPYKDLFKRNIFPRTGSMLINKTCFNKIGFFLDKLCKYEDLELNIRLIDNFKIAYTPEILLIYNRNFSHLSNNSVHIENEFASIINLSTNNIYKKLVLSENLVASIENKLLYQKRYRDAFLLLKRNFKYIIFLICIYAFIKFQTKILVKKH